MKCLKCNEELYCKNCGTKVQKYYNSALNRYIGEELPNKMTAIDVDLLMIKRYPPSGGPILRIIEYKHSGEPIGDEQGFALRKLADIFQVLNDISVPSNGSKTSSGNWRFGVYLLRGDPPFENGINIFNGITQEKKHLSKEEMDEFLLME